MKKAAIFALSFACFAATGYAEWLEKDQQTVRLDYVFADDVGSENGNGVEIAFGTALYDLDDVAVFFMHMENDDMDTQHLGLSIQEHFPIPNWSVPLIPYVGAGTGYGWMDGNVDGKDVNGGGWIARLELGAVYKFCDYFAVNAGARYNFCANEIFLEEDGGASDTQWSFALGARFYY